MLVISRPYFRRSALSPRRSKVFVTVALRASWAALVWLTFALPRPALADPTDGLSKLAAGVAVDRSTPRRTLNGMLSAVHDGDPARAAYYLDLRGIPKSQQADRGPKLASELSYVLSHENVNLAELPDTSTVPPPAGISPKSAEANLVNAGELYIGEEPVPISLVRVRFDDGVYRWLVSRTTLSMADELNETFGPKGWQTSFPEWLTRPTFFGNVLWQWIALFAIAFCSYLVGRLAAHILVSIGARTVRRARSMADDRLIRTLRRPLRMIFAATLFRAGVEALDLTTKLLSICSHAAYTALVIAAAWLVTRVLGVAASWLQESASSGQAEEYRSRGVRTQVALIQRLASVVITIVGVAVVALQFQLVRNVGLSLLASAGIASVVIGFAAQKSLAGVIAGIQLFIAQPVRIGDTVEMEGEYGTMEEMNLTYAVVKLWDARRMVVPITKLLDTSFKNLSFQNAALLGTVELVVDPATPTDLVRTQLVDICKQSADWDGKTAHLHVTNASEKGMTLRALVAAKDNERLFDLRAFVREKLLAFLRQLESGHYYANQRHAFNAPSATPISPANGPTGNANPVSV